MCARDPEAGENSGRLPGGSNVRTEAGRRYLPRGQQLCTESPRLRSVGRNTAEKRKGPDSETRKLHLGEGISICHVFSSAQSLSRVRLLCDPMNHSTPSLPVYHQLPEFTQTHVHRVSDAIQLSHPLSSPSPPAPNPSQHQGLFQ